MRKRHHALALLALTGTASMTDAAPIRRADGTSNYALCLGRQQRCVLFLSNSNRAEGIFVPLVAELLGPVTIPWEWEGYRPYDMVADADGR